MLSTLRRAGVVLAASTAGLALVLVDPAAGSAVAAGVVDPVTVPSSVIGSLDSATAAQRSAAVANTTRSAVSAGAWRVPVTSSGSLVKGVAGSPSPLTVAVSGFLLGFEGTNMVLRVAGVEGVGLEALLGAPALDPEYLPNADVGEGTPPGWVGDPTVKMGWLTDAAAIHTEGTPTVNVLPASAELILLGPCPAPRCYGVLNWPGPPAEAGYASILARYVVSPTDTRSIGGSIDSNAWLPSGSYWIKPFPLVASGAPLDRIDVYDNGSPSEPPKATWYPVGHPLRPPEFDPDPERAWETRWTCSDGSTGSLRSSSFRESDGDLPMVPDATCPSGLVVTSIQVWEVAPNGGAEDQQVGSWTLAAPVIDWQQNYPGCAAGGCILELLRVDASTGTSLSCFGNPGACVDWYTDPAKGEKYQCRYAGQIIALDECRVYSPTFNVATGTDVQTETGPRPAEETAPHADPATGKPVPADGTTPGPGPNPGPVDGSAPEGCPPPFSFTAGGFGYWVTKGVSCALAWAFVPSSTAVADMKVDVDEALEGSAMGPIQQTLDELSKVGFSGQCGLVYEQPIAAFEEHTIRLSTCDEPWASAGPLRTLVGVAFAMGTAVAIIKILTRAFGFKSVMHEAVGSEMRKETP